MISGEKGIGKKTAINIALHSKFNVVKIAPHYGSQYLCEPLVKAFSIDETIYSPYSDLTFPDYIKRTVFGFCSRAKAILYFENINQYDPHFLDFVIEIAKSVILNNPEYGTIIILEYDDKAEFPYNQVLSLPPAKVEIIRFKNLSQSDMKRYLKSNFDKLKISEPSLDYIVESASGNITYLNIIINYLRSKNIIVAQDDCHICNQIRSGFLADVMKEYILHRYALLDLDLKAILSKSTIIGNKFSVELLSKPFGIINADELLGKIEEISRLIKREFSDTFSFETTDTFLLISQMTPPKDQAEWHKVLAHYFLRLMNNRQVNSRTLSLLQEITYLYKISFHFKYAHIPQESIKYGYMLIEKYIDICDYNNAQKMIEEVRSLSDLVDIGTLEIGDLYLHLDWLEAACFIYTGQYFLACPIYERCLNFSSFKTEPAQLLLLALEASYCYFMCGDTDRSLKMCLEIKSAQESNMIDDLTYCKTLSLLSAIYSHMGNMEKTKRYYINALNLCKAKGFEEEYYRILRKASMAYGESIAVSMYPACITYFKTHERTNYLAETLHNMATDTLYLNNEEKISEFLHESIDLFKSFGSTMVHYPLNTSGIYEAVYKHNFDKALSIFTALLNYEFECGSEIVIRTNIFSCHLMMANYDLAENELRRIDDIIRSPLNQNVSEYKGFYHLNWGYYYYHIGLFNKTLDMLNAFSRIHCMEPRYKYLNDMLRYNTRKKMGLKARKPLGLPPKPILAQYDELNTYFLTLRFYE